MENPVKTSRLWLAALVVGLLGAGLLHLYLARYETEIVGGAPREVLMVTRDLPLGELLTDADLSARPLPERYVEERHVLATDLSRVVGARVTSALASGATLRYSDLDVSEEGRTLSTLVRPGMRGYSLTGQSATFEGLLRAGDRVDVLWAPAGPDEATITLLQNVLVLTVGGSMGKEAEREPARRSSAVTLSVSAAQSERLAHHERHGRLLLTLRNPHDAELVAADSAQSAGEER